MKTPTNYCPICNTKTFKLTSGVKDAAYIPINEHKVTYFQYGYCDQCKSSGKVSVVVEITHQPDLEAQAKEFKEKHVDKPSA